MHKDYAVFFATTRRFFFSLAVCLISLKKNSPKICQKADILVYHQGLTAEEQALLNNILPCKFTEYRFAVDTDFDNINFKKFTQLAFARYEIFDLLDQYKKILYMDVDIMIGGELDYIFENYGGRGGIAWCKDRQKGLSLITKNFIRPLARYDMTVPCYNSGVILFCQSVARRKELRMWCYRKTAEWLENLVCPDQGVLNVMIQEFGIDAETLPDTCNCLPSNPKFLDKNRKDVLVYHCAGGGVRFWTYTWNAPWQKLYAEYLAMGGEPHTDEEHGWLKLIKKFRLVRWDFFDRSPDPKMHPARFLKYAFLWPFKYLTRKK